MEEKILESKMNSPYLEDYLIQKKIEVMFEVFSKKMANEFSRMNDKIVELKSEIETIKEKGKSNFKETIQIIEKPVEHFNYPKDGQQVKQNTNLLSPTSQQTKPRYGNYKPEDVSIEKFFYSGGK